MIPRRERIAYAAGDVGFSFVWYSTEFYLLYFYVRVLGIPPTAAAGVFLLASLVDLAADPLIGAFVDRTGGRIAMRRWVLIGGAGASALLVVCFTPPPLPGGAIAVYAAGAHVALRLAYSLGNIPYAALTSRMSNRRVDHLALTTLRMQGAAIGGLIAAALFALLPRVGGQADFATGALGLAALAVPLFAATAMGVTERRPVRPRADAVGSRPPLGSLLTSAPLRRLLVAVLLMGTSISALLASLLFLFESMGALRAGYLAALLPPATLLVASPIWARIGEAAGAVGTLVGAAALAAGALALLPFAEGAAVGTLAIATAVTCGAGMSVLFWSLAPGVIAELERDDPGHAYAGSVYGLATTARKLAQGAAPFLVLADPRGSVAAVVAGLLAAAAAALLGVLLYPPRPE